MTLTSLTTRYARSSRGAATSRTATCDRSRPLHVAARTWQVSAYAHHPRRGLLWQMLWRCVLHDRPPLLRALLERQAVHLTGGALRAALHARGLAAEHDAGEPRPKSWADQCEEVNDDDETPAREAAPAPSSLRAGLDKRSCTLHVAGLSRDERVKLEGDLSGDLASVELVREIYPRYTRDILISPPSSW